MKNETIHIENLSIGYPGKSDVKVVADGICAGINSGELTCLLGANGVGKSTLLRTLSAFQPKLGGEIRIQGKEIESYTDKQLSRVISVVLTEKDLALNGSLSSFFARKGIVFDLETGLFRVDNEYTMQIRLSGHGQRYAMVRKALQRNGILANRNVESETYIETGDLKGGGAFVLHRPGEEPICLTSIGDLLAKLHERRCRIRTLQAAFLYRNLYPTVKNEAKFRGR